MPKRSSGSRPSSRRTLGWPDLLREQLDQPDQADATMDAREVKGGADRGQRRRRPKRTWPGLELSRLAHGHRRLHPTDVAKALELAPDDKRASCSPPPTRRGPPPRPPEGQGNAGPEPKNARSSGPSATSSTGIEKHPKNRRHGLRPGRPGDGGRASRRGQRISLRMGLKKLPEDRGPPMDACQTRLAHAGECECRPADESRGVERAAGYRPRSCSNTSRASSGWPSGGGARRPRSWTRRRLHWRRVPRRSRQPKRSLLLLGDCYDRLGNIDQAYVAYRSAAGTPSPPSHSVHGQPHGWASPLPW